MSYPCVTGLEVCGYVVDAVPCDCPGEYGSQVIVDIEGLTGPFQAENFGRMNLTKISLCRALEDGVALKEICRDQAKYCMLYSLFERDCTVRKELKVDPNWTDLLVFEEMAIKRPFRTSAVVERAIETVIAFLGPRSLIVLESSQGCGMDLTNDECMTLGLKAVPDAPLFIRGPRCRGSRREKTSTRRAKLQVGGLKKKGPRVAAQ